MKYQTRGMIYEGESGLTLISLEPEYTSDIFIDDILAEFGYDHDSDYNVDYIILDDFYCLLNIEGENLLFNGELNLSVDRVSNGALDSEITVGYQLLIGGYDIGSILAEHDLQFVDFRLMDKYEYQGVML